MKIRPYRGNRWRADCGIIQGRRIRTVFSTKAEAQQYVQMMQERKTAARLGMADLDIRTAEDAKRAAEILSGKTTLAAAAQFWSENHRDGAARKLGEIMKEFCEHLRSANARPRYVNDIEDTLLNFMVRLDNPLIGDCTTERILEWLRWPEWSKATFRNRRRELSVFFNWCVKQGILALNPVARIPSPKLDERKIEVLTIDQTRRLLNGLQGSDRAYFAIALFAGLRPAEIDRLTWADVKLDRDYIDLRGQHSKTGARRLVTIQPNLKAWIDGCCGNEDYHIRPYKQVFDEYISRCDKYELMKRACHAAGLAKWPQNVCRHSFASYHLAKWRNAQETALQLGHATTAMLFRHYREVVTEQEAEAFWSIFPGDISGALIPFPRPAEKSV